MSTQTSPDPAIKTTREDRHVITIPEARTPRRWIPFVTVTIVVVGALVLGVMGGSISRRGIIRDRDARIASAQEAARVASVQAAQAQEQAAGASALVDTLTARLAGKQQALALQHARGHESGLVLASLRARLAALRGLLAQARGRAALLTGPPLRAGRYAVRLLAAGALQSPPRLVFDLGTWLRGPAARRAAIADGAIGPNGRLPHHRYFRNHDVSWRLMAVASGASVSLRNHRGRPVYDDTLVQLQDLLLGRTALARSVQRDPFWIVVHGGTIVSVQRQAYP